MFGQIENDKKWWQHWENKPNSLIYEHNTNNSLGLVINGLIMRKTDRSLLSYIKKLTGFQLDTNNFYKNFDSTLLLSLNDSLTSILSRIVVNDDSIKFFYIFQYLHFGNDSGDYVLISTKIIGNEKQDYTDSVFCKEFDKEIKMDRLVFSRIFLRKPLDYSEKSNKYHFLLYDIKQSKIFKLEN